MSLNDLSGVHVALTTPFDAMTGDIDLAALETHAAWLLENGISGLVPNGSLGEYESMDRDERRAVVETVARVTNGRGKLIVGVSAPNWRIAGDHARHAADVGADAVMLLPPTNHASTRAELLDHYRSVAQQGVPVVVYNNPFSTRTDLTPEIIAELGELDGITAVKEFSGDVRRIAEIAERSPHLQVLCGADDLALESALMGATGWIGGFTGALPRETIRLFELGRLGDVAAALPLYRGLLPLLRWDSGPRFVEAIKYAIDLLGLSAGGAPRPPRRILDELDRELVTRQLQNARGAIGA
ncbi:MAG: dihydrodipicolinate synthase family protein [Actinomycetota bacterium]|nr:dihydrodipicolinate synthase family protein [Actinomycetota bacterium]